MKSAQPYMEDTGFSSSFVIRGEQDRTEVSVVMACLNEAETLATCIRKAREALERQQIAGEVIVADNGSTDGSQEIARNSGARIIQVESKGYGSALRGGVAAAQGRFVIIGDADGSYDIGGIPAFLDK